MTPEQQKEMREHAWQYFICHAEARLTTFRFYLVFCTIIGAGLIALMSRTAHAWTGIPLSLILTFLSFIYWKVDIRHKQLINRGETALQYLEGFLPVTDIEDEPHVLKLFSAEAYRARSLKRFPKHLSLNAHFSYSTCVNMVFLLFGLSGGILTMVLLLV